MKSIKNKITYEKSTYTSIFNIEAINDRFEDDVYEVLNKLRYGDGRHYLRKHGNKIFRIEFVIDDEYYVGEEFGKMHAEEIQKALKKLAYKFGTQSALLA